MTKEEIEFNIKLCTNCELYKETLNSVPGVVIPNSEICIIGEAPGAMEDVRGIPFIGESGQLLDKKLAEFGIDRATCSVLNTVKHRPPDNRAPTEDEVFWCYDFLKAQIDIIKPKYVLCLGKTAIWTIIIKKRADFFTPKINTTGNMTKFFGKFFDRYVLDNKFKALAFYHPSYWLRKPQCIPEMDKQFRLLRDDIDGTNS